MKPCIVERVFIGVTRHTAKWYIDQRNAVESELCVQSKSLPFCVLYIYLLSKTLLKSLLFSKSLRHNHNPTEGVVAHHRSLLRLQVAEDDEDQGEKDEGEDELSDDVGEGEEDAGGDGHKEGADHCQCQWGSSKDETHGKSTEEEDDEKNLIEKISKMSNTFHISKVSWNLIKCQYLVVIIYV